MKKVLFVCLGNINRSAAAEIISKKDYPNLEVKSCGLKAKQGQITSRKMRDALALNGYETNSIRSTLITEELVSWADKVFYMDNSNEKRFKEKFGELNKAEKLSNYANVDKIPDPHFAKASDGLSQHLNVIKLIQTALKKWTTE